MEFLDLARQRYSVRAYQPQAVEEAAVERIIEAGRVAPTAANRQPVRIVQVSTSEGLDRLAQGAEVYGAPLAFVVCANRERAWRRDYDGKVTADIDASIVTDHMMLEATSLGLGTVWVCWFDPQAVSRALGLPEGWEPVNILAVGHAACTPASAERHATERISTDELVIARM